MEGLATPVVSVIIIIIIISLSFLALWQDWRTPSSWYQVRNQKKYQLELCTHTDHTNIRSYLTIQQFTTLQLFFCNSQDCFYFKFLAPSPRNMVTAGREPTRKQNIILRCWLFWSAEFWNSHERNWPFKYETVAVWFKDPFRRAQ